MHELLLKQVSQYRVYQSFNGFICVSQTTELRLFLYFYYLYPLYNTNLSFYPTTVRKNQWGAFSPNFKKILLVPYLIGKKSFNSTEKRGTSNRRLMGGERLLNDCAGANIYSSPSPAPFGPFLSYE